MKKNKEIWNNNNNNTERKRGKGTNLWALYSYSKLMSCGEEEEEGEVPP